MSIYKEPPPGMFVVPDTVDMTKVCNLMGRGQGNYWKIRLIKLKEPKTLFSFPLVIEMESKPQESKWLAKSCTVRSRILSRSVVRVLTGIVGLGKSSD